MEFSLKLPLLIKVTTKSTFPELPLKLPPKFWVAAGLLAPEAEEIEVELPIADDVNEEVILLRELTENYEKMVMEEGTSNEDQTPPDELMSDNEVILYEITDEPVDSPVQEQTNEKQTRPREKKLKQSRIGDFFSKK